MLKSNGMTIKFSDAKSHVADLNVRFEAKQNTYAPFSRALQNSYLAATGRPLSDIYPYLMPISLRECKEDTFSCKGKASGGDIKP